MARDIEKLRAARRRWYAKNQEHAIKKVSQRKQMLLEWLQNLKSSLFCEQCGENHIAVLDFHHVNPSEKELNLSLVVTNGWSKQRILAEMDKCKILCANCHRKLHWSEKNPG